MQFYFILLLFVLFYVIFIRKEFVIQFIRIMNFKCFQNMKL